MFKFLKYQKYRFDYVYANKLKHKAPIDVMLELSSHCQLACNYCYHSDQKNLPFKKDHMHPLIAYKVIREAAECGVKSLKFNFRGESTLNPHYRNITEHARSFRKGSTFIELTANSNFSFNSNRKDIFDGLANLTKVKISYDSFNKEIFEKQRNGSSHELVTKNIDIFYNYPKRIHNKTEIVIQAVRSHHNKDEDIEGQVKKRWPGVQVSIRDVVTGRVDGFKGIKSRDKSERLPCLQAFSRLIIRSDGGVGICCPDIKEKIKVGTVHDSTVLELFNSEKAKSIRKALKNKSAFDSDPCKGCSSFETFKGYKHGWKS